MRYPTVVTTVLTFLLTTTCSSFSTTLGTNHHHHNSLHNHVHRTNEHHKGLYASIEASTTQSSSSSSSLSSSSSTPPPSVSNQRRNIFQSGVYNKPIVLIGCRGAGNELYRLAESIPSDNVGGRSTTLSFVRGDDKEEGTGGGISTPEDLRRLLRTKTIDRSHILVLDFDAPGIADDDSAIEDLTSLARAAYEDENMLSIYINIDPQTGGMSSSGQHIRTTLETDVFRACSDYELCIKHEGASSSSSSSSSSSTEWSTMEWQLHRILSRATLPPPTPGSYTPSTNTARLTMGRHTFFLSLSFPTATDVQPYVESMCRDVDAMELRADLLSQRDDHFEVLYQTQGLRALCREYAVRAPLLPGLGGTVIEDAVPIVYTVRTQHQAGTYPDDPEGIHNMFRLLQTGLRGAVEVLDVEAAWDPIATDALLTSIEERYASQILGSHHVTDRPIPTEEAADWFTRCALNGRADAAKVVLTVDTPDEGGVQARDASRMAQTRAKTEDDGGGVGEGRLVPDIPRVGVALGEVGRYSRALNVAFTPVTHEDLPFVAAPGQLSARELMEMRKRDGLVSVERYGILGSGISYSVSPAMQGGAFEACGLPHTFELVDRETVEEIVDGEFWNDDAFAGCCVTIPHKQSIVPYVDELTEAAEAIGAVNTVVVKRDNDDQDCVQEKKKKKVLLGDNTDWRGIFNPLQRRLGGSVASTTGANEGTKNVALILGGGGTARAAAYAATQLGLERVYYNRTPSKAEELADAFGGNVVYSLDDDHSDDDDNNTSPNLGRMLRSMNGRITTVISTLPAAAEFELPSWVVEEVRSDSRTIVVFDVNYKPYHTKLLRQAEAAGFPVVRGSEMLWEQGVGQFELWTERTAPYGVMKAAVLKNCLPEEEKEEK